MKKLFLSLMLLVPMMVAAQDSVPMDDRVYIICDQMPQYPGGKAALSEFLAENMQYPESALQNGVEGRVICQFVVERDGSRTDIRVVKSDGNAELDNEAVRLIQLMPPFVPGRVARTNTDVRARCTLPINFSIEKYQEILKIREEKEKQ